MSIWEKGEIQKIKKWFYKISPDGESINVPKIPYVSVPGIVIPYNIGDSYIWVDFSRNIMSLGCSIWDEISKGYSTLIVQELAKYYKLKNAGWDAVGYCLKEFLEGDGIYIPRENPYFVPYITEYEKVDKILKENVVELIKKGLT